MTNGSLNEKLFEEESPEDEALSKLLDNYAESQYELLRLGHFISMNSSEIDSPKERAWNDIQRKFPDADPGEFMTAWEAFQKVLTHSYSESDETAGLTEADKMNTKDEVRSDIDALFKALPQDIESGYFRALSQPKNVQPSSPLLLSSLLVTVVSEFEILIGNLIREFLTRYPQALESIDRKYTWKEIAGFDSMDEFREIVIERAVDQTLRGSNQDWMDLISRRFKVAIPSLCKQPEFQEIFQRRHLIVHNGGIVNSIYLDKAGPSAKNRSLGEELSVDINYLNRAADVLLAAGVALLANTTAKLFKQTERYKTVDGVFTHLTYELLQYERFECVILLHDQVSDDFGDETGKLVRQVNHWLSQKRLSQLDGELDRIEKWDTRHLGEEFQLARLALLDNHEEALLIVDEIRGTRKLSTELWLEWPLLSELREYERNLPNNVEPAE